MKAKDFLDEYYKLRSKLDNFEKSNVENLIHLLKMLRDGPHCLDLDKAIAGFESVLEGLR